MSEAPDLPPSLAEQAHTRALDSPHRDREGTWSWVAHRMTGVLIFFFLLLHVLDTALVRVSPESYDQVADVYRNPVVALLELVLVGAVLFHTLNGLRVTAIDFWSAGARFQRHMLYGTVLVWVAVMVPAAFFMLTHAARALFGST